MRFSMRVFPMRNLGYLASREQWVCVAVAARIGGARCAGLARRLAASADDLHSAREQVEHDVKPACKTSYSVVVYTVEVIACFVWAV